MKTTSECNSAGRVSRCQRDCRRFESGHSLHFFVFFALKCQSFRVIFFIRIWMHNHGIKIKHLSDDDIANIIFRSAKAAKD